MERPSGDQRGLDAAPSAGPSRDDCFVATFMIHTWEYGRPGRSLFTMEYATRVASGDRWTSATERRRGRSELWRPAPADLAACTAAAPAPCRRSAANPPKHSANAVSARAMDFM